MDKKTYTITRNQLVARDTYELVLSGDGCIKGEFVHLDIPGYYLRRPFSLCDSSENSITLLYKTVGEGTRKLATLREGPSCGRRPWRRSPLLSGQKAQG